MPELIKGDDLKTVAEERGWKLSSSPAPRPGEVRLQSVTQEPSEWPIYNWLVGNNYVLVKNESSQTITVVMRAQQQNRTDTTRGHADAKAGVPGVVNLGAGLKRTVVIKIPPSDPMYHVISGGKDQLFSRYDGISIVDCVILVKAPPTSWYDRLFGGGGYTRYDKFQMDLYKVAAVVVKDEDLSSDKSTGTVPDINTVLND